MSSPSATLVAGEGTAAAVSPRQPRPPRRNGSRLFPLWLLTPAGLVMIALVLAPIAFLVFTSFTDYNQRSLFTGAFDFVGFDQYTKIFADPDFWWSVVRTLLFTTAMVVGTIVIGMGMAQLLTRLGTVMRYVVTVVMIFAWAMPTVASSQVWNWLFQPGYGVVNWLLTQTHLFGDMTNVAWANNPFLAYVCIWLLIVWGGVPLIALTLYAAQTQVDPAYLEAARLDGAGEARIYFSIVLTFLRPTLLLMTILSVIWDFNVFNQIWLVSQGGPNDATATLGIFAYKTAFVGTQVGTGSAITVVTTIMLLIVTAFYIRNLLRSGEDL
ncbi:carbohydrate ABC transporter permease [Rathayibacter sp. CAU 1779]